MDLIKKNIHMDRTGVSAVSQFTLEDDRNIPDNKPDVSAILFDSAGVVLEDVKPFTDYVSVRGRLAFRVLYHTQEEGSSLVALEGKISFDEKINMDGVEAADTVTVKPLVEDLTVGIINSRKLSVQALVCLKAQVEDLYDEEVPVELQGQESVEYRRTPMELARIAISKNDIFRIREEVSLPSGHPNIFQILWSDLGLHDVECRVQEEKISLQGELRLFVLYEGEGEDHPVRSFEAVIPFGGSLDCHGSSETMLADITYAIGQQELNVRPDLDGEERVIGLEAALDIAMKLYEEERLDVITDVYGVTSEVETQSRPADLRRLISRINGKMKVSDHVRLTEKDGGILQLLHCEAAPAVEQKEITEKGIQLTGSLQLRALYVTGDDSMPYNSLRAQIPFRYTLEIPGLTLQDTSEVSAMAEQLQVTMLGSDELDVKAVLSFGTMVFRSVPTELISDIRIQPLDTARLGTLPGMAIYVVKPGDNLWNIGKRFYLPVQKLRELNDLNGSEIRPGQKLLVVKGGHREI